MELTTVAHKLGEETCKQGCLLLNERETPGLVPFCPRYKVFWVVRQGT